MNHQSHATTIILCIRYNASASHKSTAALIIIILSTEYIDLTLLEKNTIHLNNKYKLVRKRGLQCDHNHDHHYDSSLLYVSNASRICTKKGSTRSFVMSREAATSFRTFWIISVPAKSEVVALSTTPLPSNDRK